MGFRVPPRPVALKCGPVESRTYLEWLHGLPCVITKGYPVDAAHVSFEANEWCAFGRGKGQKVSDRWALPLRRDKHREQHGMGERAFWDKHGINPHYVGCVLWGLWNERGEEATEFAVRFIRNL